MANLLIARMKQMGEKERSRNYTAKLSISVTEFRIIRNWNSIITKFSSSIRICTSLAIFFPVQTVIL